MINHIIIRMGPSVSDPADVIKMVLVTGTGEQHFIGLPTYSWKIWRKFVRKSLWARFLVWSIRNYVRWITE